MKSSPRERVQRSMQHLREMYHRAEFSKTADALDALLATGTAPADAVLLRARIALRLRKPAEALEVVARFAKRLTTHEERARAAILSGAAYSRLGDQRAANAQFKAAAPVAARDESVRMTLLYERAAAAWIARKLDTADALLDELEGFDVPIELLVEARVLRGVVFASRENLAAQGAILLETLRLVRSADDPSLLHWAAVACQVATLAREMPSRALRDAAFHELARIPWTSDLAEYHFEMLRAVAWRHALDGDFFNAFRRLKDAHAVAPSDGWRVTSSSDRAYFGTVLGERRWAEQELSDAHELAASVPWAALDGEERFALMVMSELFAPRDPALALSYVAKYKDAGGRYARTLASSDDPRVNAEESYAFGVVQKALGETEEAVRLLRDAWDVYDRIGYDWRAGRAALALADATGDDTWKERAAKKLRGYERSWLRAEQPATFRESPDASKLTPARRAVYELLLRGLSTSAIAAEQQRSEFTVRNHIKAIFKVFGVTSRPALIAKAIGTAGTND